jgi:hypothetical protein
MQLGRSPGRRSGRISRRATTVAVIGSTLGLVLGATSSFGADSGTVDAEVTVAQAAACLELSTGAVGFGTLALGAENAPGTPGITVSNCGDADATIFASGTNATGSAAAWNLVDSAATCADTLGTDNYHLGLATPAGASIASLSTENKEVGTLAGAATADHVARISTACPGSSGAGQVMSMQINYLATNVVTPPIVLEQLVADQSTADALAAYVLPEARDYDVPAQCGATAIACPGGVPSDPLPQVRLQASNVGAVQVPGTLQWNASGDLAATTLQAIPVTIEGISCDLTINSANGALTVFSGTAEFTFLSYPDPAGPVNYLQVGNANITGVEEADITLSGSFTCQLADSLKGFYIPMLVDQIAAYIEGNICGDPNSTGYIPCPTLP